MGWFGRRIASPQELASEIQRGTSFSKAIQIGYDRIMCTCVVTNVVGDVIHFRFQGSGKSGESSMSRQELEAILNPKPVYAEVEPLPASTAPTPTEVRQAKIDDLKRANAVREQLRLTPQSVAEPEAETLTNLPPIGSTFKHPLFGITYTVVRHEGSKVWCRGSSGNEVDIDRTQFEDVELTPPAAPVERSRPSVSENIPPVGQIVRFDQMGELITGVVVGSYDDHPDGKLRILVKVTRQDGSTYKEGFTVDRLQWDSKPPVNRVVAESVVAVAEAPRVARVLKEAQYEETEGVHRWEIEGVGNAAVYTSGEFRTYQEDQALVLVVMVPKAEGGGEEKVVAMSAVDGMGGHAGGDVATKLFAEEFTSAIKQLSNTDPRNITASFNLAINNTQPRIRQWFDQNLPRLQREARAKGKNPSDIREPDLVFTSTIIVGNKAYYCDVGDAKRLILRGGVVLDESREESTRDERGESLVTNSVMGLSDVTIGNVGLMPGDVLVSMTDGPADNLANMSAGEIEQHQSTKVDAQQARTVAGNVVGFIRSSTSVQDLVRNIIDFTKDRVKKTGTKKDNFTLLALEYNPSGEELPPEQRQFCKTPFAIAKEQAEKVKEKAKNALSTLFGGK